MTAASAGMPWIALAYKSVMMYLVTISAALRLGGPRVAGQPPEWRDVAERQEHRIGVPHFLPHPGGGVRVALLRGKPFGEYRLGVDPAQEVAVVIGVAPGKPALVAGVMPEADRELDRL